MEQELAKFRFLGFKIPHSEINLKDYSSKSSQDFTIKISAEGKIVNDNNFILQMHVTVGNNDNSVNIKTDLTGNFEFEELSEEVLNSFFCANAPAIMFPYVRAYITSLTALSGIDAIIIPTLNMTQLGEEIKNSLHK